MKRIYGIFLVFLSFIGFLNGKKLGLYDSNEADIIIYKTSGDAKDSILNSNKITIVQFYSSSMCHSCKEFKPNWISFSKETKLWQNVILSLAVVDCNETSLLEICDFNRIKTYPEFVFFHAWQQRAVGIKKENVSLSNEQFMISTIDFFEKQRHWPLEWPSLAAYT